MIRPRTLRRWLLLTGMLVAVSGCSLLSQPFAKKEVAPPAPPPVQKPAPMPELPQPVATERFELPDDQANVVGVVQTVIASKEDTLPDIARRFDVGYEEIVRANPGVDPWLPGAGRRVVLPTQFVLPNAPHEGVVINLPAMRLFYFPKHNKGEPQVVYTYPIGVGKAGWRTPEGVTKVVSREKNPTWRPSAGVRKEHAENDDPVPAVVLPGPDNPLGKFKFNLGWPSYLIHGTNKPYGVGLRSSHGCIRLYPEDIEKLFDAVPIGTSVRVVNQPFVFGWQDGKLYIQAYTVLEDDKRDWQEVRHALLARAVPAQVQKQLKDASAQVDWDAVMVVARQPRGIAVPVSTGDTSVEAVVGQAALVQNRIPEGSNWDGADDIERDEKSYQQVLSEREQPAAGAAARPHT